MESEAEGLREHRSRGGRFRAEIGIDRGVTIPRGPEAGFAAAVREPLVKLQRPRFEFEQWDWDYLAWPHDRLDANLEMRDSDPGATFEADRKASEDFLHRSTLQLDKHERDRCKPEQKDMEPEDEDRFVASLLADDEPTGCSSSVQWSTARHEHRILVAP
ncbi:hypothetical protein E2562_034183 [Oryza meyeriana var. granulata]|uniref:Uncharacterized protein n=1 Tax=Oryza meyeriana var. granulata TaxID=110450 RepID=A0A6G1F1D1_9ORYZ|nr:hypothetical protein E2562_034183 [Oryza meyeriana var. granulata]